MGEKRTVFNYTLNKPESLVQYLANDYFIKEGFHLVDYKGEQVWKKGTGILTAPSYIKMIYKDGVLHLEAWIRFLGERAIDEGFVGIIPKRMHQKRVEELVGVLSQNNGSPSYYAAAGAQAAYPQQAGYSAPGINWQPQASTQNFAAPGSGYPPQGSSDGQQPQTGANMPYSPAMGPYPPQGPNYVTPPVQTHDPANKATLSLVLGIVSFLGIYIPILGVVCGGIGISAGRTGRGSSRRGLATAGLVLSIIGLVLSVLMWVISFIVLMNMGV